MPVHVFGIRHHGPGSARSLLAAFDRLQPATVLVEGPVEANDQISWLFDPAMKPPVALLIYRPDMPLASVFYPFATFSPEWNALRYAQRKGVPARFIDLPKSNWMAIPPDLGPAEKSPEDEAPEGEPPQGRAPEQKAHEAPVAEGEDALMAIARIAGEEDFERWWDRLVESRGDDQVFAAIHEAMAALRADGP